jgi:crotonobetainyl-CoA:carnitine CoA-transferase CaiB-like acyl-CoA transferase
MSSVLAGLRVVDFTHIFAGPLATEILGDLGADVIKIERTDGGDAARLYGLTDPEQLSGAFVALNRNKRSLAIDLGQEDGRRIVKELIDGADVVVENFRPGVMEKLGLDYEALAADNPRLVYCAISGFGREGGLATKAANDLIIQAYSGLMSFTGEPGRPPVRAGTALSDFSGGLYAALGILAALLHRGVSGRGQRVETSLLESQLSLLNYFFADYWLHGIIPGPMGTGNRLGMPNQAFPTADGYVVITAANDRMYERCCQGLGVPELAQDPRFSTLANRYLNRDELVELLSARTRTQTTAEVVRDLEALGVSCGPINNVAQAASSPAVSALGIVTEVPVQGRGPATVIGSPLHLSETPVTVREPVPLIGGSTEMILAELGYSPDQIDALAAAAIVHMPDKDPERHDT